MQTHPAQGDFQWEQELANLLDDMAHVQAELLSVLDAKRVRLSQGDAAGADELHSRTEQLLQQLQSCHERRARLLAKHAGGTAADLGKLALRASKENRGSLAKQVKETSLRMRLLHHQSLSNWVLAQRSLLHIAQMLEIIATGGRLQATYGPGDSSSSGGALVDRAA